jgi:hypothetical protein
MLQLLASGDGALVIPVNWQAVGVLATVLVGWTTVLLSAIKWLLDRYVKTIERRLGALEERVGRVSDVERDLMHLKASLADTYVRREDWIRFMTYIDAKFDNLRAALFGQGGIFHG